MKTIDHLKPLKVQHSRPNKHISFSIDPMSQEKLYHLTEVIKHITHTKEVSQSIVIRRAIEALVDHYDSLMIDGGDYTEEERHIKSVVKPDDYNICLTDTSLQPYYDKLRTACGARALESSTRLKESMRGDMITNQMTEEEVLEWDLR